MTTRVLVIGEKPSQVKTIASTLLSSSTTEKAASRLYLRKGLWDGKELIFIPLIGHITNIDTSETFGWNKCKPIEIVEKNSQALVIKTNSLFSRVIKDKARKVDELWLATDPDSEGDNIAFEAYQIAIAANPQLAYHTKRVWNSSLTRNEIIRSFNNLISWETYSALAVQGRRIVDAWMGFAGTREITGAARKVVKQRGLVLSVGRVQLPTLKLIVDRERERRLFSKTKKYNIVASVLNDQKTETLVVVKHEKSPFEDKKIVDGILQNLKGSTTGLVRDFQVRKVNIMPPRPMNTTDCLALLTKELKVNVEKAMEILATLYENGYISYPRTENRQFKAKFPHMDILAKLSFFNDFKPHLSRIKDASQVRTNGRKIGTEDHDPIHPTGEIPKESTIITSLHVRAWNYISLYYSGMFMPDLIQSRGKVTILIKNEPFIGQFQNTLDFGFTEAIFWKKPRNTPVFNFNKNQTVQVGNISAKSFFTQPPPYWTDSALIKILEKLKIGTKSSRPDIINKLQLRNYIIRKGQSYQATELGESIITLFEGIWSDVVSPSFTRLVEKKMEDVAAKKAEYKDMLEFLRQYYLELHHKLLANSAKLTTLLKNVFNNETLGKQNEYPSKEVKKPVEQLGNCPLCQNGNIVKRYNRTSNQVFFGCSNYPSCKWTSQAKKNSKGEYVPITSGKDVVGNCPTCSGRLILKRVKGYRLIGCSNYPECKVSYFLPKTGRIQVVKQKCPECSRFMISFVKINKDNKPSEKKVYCPVCSKKQG
ncbi:MAG: DNA topoisomerase [Candidatus Hodarchaeales archaeon]